MSATDSIGGRWAVRDVLKSLERDGGINLRSLSPPCWCVRTSAPFALLLNFILLVLVVIFFLLLLLYLHAQRCSLKSPQLLLRGEVGQVGPDPRFETISGKLRS
eukprot:jgi/Tetstr1/436393/TSEL_025225.t1